jgi:hypothetical protein
MDIEPMKLSIAEGIASVWHYHLSLDGGRTAICGETRIMPTQIPVKTWGMRESHIPVSYCSKCHEWVGKNVTPYKYMARALPLFLKSIGCPNWDAWGGLIRADGDKCTQYRSEWKGKRIQYHEGALVYLLGSISPWSNTVRDTTTGWVNPSDWVVERWNGLREHIPVYTIEDVDTRYLKWQGKP